MSEQIMTCNICVEPFNKRDHSVVSCPYCQYEACRTCCESFLLTVSEPKCMEPACGKAWTYEFLTATFTQNFVRKTYKEYREKLFFEREMALMPATQVVIESIIKKEKIQKEIDEITREMTILKQKRDNLVLSYHNVDRAPPKERKEFIRRCGVSECKGFLSTQWKCGLCEKHTCKECHEVKNDTEHVCNKDNVETAKLLASDSKGCPQCATLIFKISGCDQMWCTQCHCAFSWKSGRVETNIHNPHYFEWLRRSGGQAPRNPNDIICGRELTHHWVRPIVSHLRKFNSGNSLRMATYVSQVIEAVIHLTQVEIPRYRMDQVVNTEPLRIKYMRNIIDEATFKILVQREQIKFEKKREIHNVLTMFVQSITDIMFRFSEKLTHPTSLVNHSNYSDVLREIAPLTDYVNECLHNVSKIYNSQKLGIHLPDLDKEDKRFQRDLILSSEKKTKKEKKVVAEPLPVIVPVVVPIDLLDA